MGIAKQRSAMNIQDPDLDYDKLKADVATMRANCVTRQDLAALEVRVLSLLERMGERLEANTIGLAALKAQFATELPHLATKADLHQFASSIRAWMVTAMISMFFGFAGLGFVVVNALKPLASS